jgi:hypothetical protein
MDSIDYQIETLRLFNEKVEELFNLSFVQAIINPKMGFNLSGERQTNGTFKLRSKIIGPSVEAIKAFVLTFRFFIQDNESISLHKIASIYDSTNIEDKQKEFFNSARNSVNEMLDSPNLFSLKINDSIPTNREILDTFIYGGLAHAHPEKYKLFKEWMNFPPTAVILQTCFNTILGQILQALDYIKNVNMTTIDQLSYIKKSQHI